MAGSGDAEDHMDFDKGGDDNKYDLNRKPALAGAASDGMRKVGEALSE